MLSFFIEKILKEKEVSRKEEIEQLEAEYKAKIFRLEEDLDKIKMENLKLQKEVEIFEQKGKL